MSKTKTEKHEVIDNNQTDQDLVKILGVGGMMNANDIVATSSSVIKVSPAIDIGLSGGIPGGTTVVLTGKPKVGKTTLALTIMAQGQKDGRKCFYESVEGRLKEMNLNGVKDLRRDMLEVISSYKDETTGKIVSLTAEQYLDAGLAILRNNPRCILCIDSIAALCPEAEFQLSMNEYAKMAGVPTLLYKFFRQVAQILPVNDSILILITHMISNPGAKGNQKQTNEKGGNAQAYQADVKLEAMYTELIDDGGDAETKKILGQICHWKVICSALGPPFGKIKSHIRYGYGIDNIAELIELGTLYGFITGKGWYTLSFLSQYLNELGLTEWDEETSKKYKFQGAKKVYAALAANPKWVEYLENDLKSMLCSNYQNV